MPGPGDTSLYNILGVQKSDSASDIKKAYLKLARTHHPDKGGDTEKFKEIQRAYEVLGDEHKRRMYDEHGVIGDENGGMSNGGGMAGGFPFNFPFEVNMNDLFGNMFGGGPRGNAPQRRGKKAPPITQVINITLEQFYLGRSFDININRQCFCTDCDHSGAKSKETCADCKGRGMVSQVVQMGPMIMQTNGPCGKCEGRGEKILEKCGKCSGTGFLSETRSLGVKINPGTKPGEVFVFPEVCSDSPQFEKPGDAHIIINEDPNDPAFKVFKRSGDKLQHLETKVVLSLSESLVGCVIRIDNHPGYDDGLFCKIPSGSFQGDKYCINGLGMPIMGDIGRYGDLYITIEVSIKPTERKLFSTQGRELLAPLFEDKIRTSEIPSDTEVFNDLYLVGK
jgi:DnaJ family protein A protein 2